MQTFLPFPDFAASARCLDYKRLGKQRVECAQILNALCHGKGWSSHPATRMWRGYERALCIYGHTMVVEWTERGYNNSMDFELIARQAGFDSVDDAPMPPWIGNAAFHASHRSNLLRKDPAHYGQFGWAEPHDLPYVWPCD